MEERISPRKLLKKYGHIRPYSSIFFKKEFDNRQKRLWDSCFKKKSVLMVAYFDKNIMERPNYDLMFLTKEPKQKNHYLWVIERESKRGVNYYLITNKDNETPNEILTEILFEDRRKVHLEVKEVIIYDKKEIEKLKKKLLIGLI